MKRKTLDVQRQVLKAIRENPNIRMKRLERKVGTNPRSLKEHCEQLEFLELIKIAKTDEGTTVRSR